MHQQFVLLNGRARDIIDNNIHRIFLLEGQILPKIRIKTKKHSLMLLKNIKRPIEFLDLSV